MKPETVERILKERGAKKKGGGYPVSDGEVATLLLGGDPPNATPGIVRFTLLEDVLLLESKKGASTYLEYDLVRGITFEPKSVADRRPGF